MHHLTKGILKRPTTVIVSLMALVVFLIVAVLSITMQLMPDMSMPYMMVQVVYPGAEPSDSDKLVAQKMVGELSTLTGVRTAVSEAGEDYSYVMLQFEYGTNMDKSYDDVKKTVDRIKNQFPDDAQEPVIMEIDMNSGDDMTLSVTSKIEGIDVLNEVEENVEPELQKVSALAQVNISGGNKKYISVSIIPEYAAQYGLNVPSIASAISAVNFTMPVGSADNGDMHLNVSADSHYETVEQLKEVPITTSKGKIIHLGDIANIDYALTEKTSNSRYNGKNNVSVGLKRKQSSTSVTLSNQVKKELKKIQEKNPNLDINIVSDSADMIKSSLSSVGWTLLEGIALSMFVLFLFFGDFKASLIVGSSMPISLAITFVIMYYAGLTLNIITMSSLVIGIGMMVDNAIVVIEMCFRLRQKEMSFYDSAYQGTKIVMRSIIGSTITTVVVYLPLAIMEGLSAMLFKPLAFTIIFAITSSLFSAITIVPFFYNVYKPEENLKNPVSKGMRRLEDFYGRVLAKVLNKKKLATLFAILLFAGTIALVPQLGTELMGQTDEGEAGITMTFRPNLSLEAMDRTVKEMEQYVEECPYIDGYTTRVNQTSAQANIYAYKAKKSKLSTSEIVDLLNKELKDFSSECEVSVAAISSMGGGDMSSGSSIEIEMVGTDYDRLKEGHDLIMDKLDELPGVLNTKGSMTERGTRARVIIDPVMANARGFTAGSLAQMVYQNMNGQSPMDVDIEGKKYKVTVEYPTDRYDNISDIEAMTFTNQSGVSVPLSEMAKVEFTSSARDITRYNGRYYATIDVTTTTDQYDTVKKQIDDVFKEVRLPGGVERQTSTMDEMIGDEFTALIRATVIAVFLVFMVMAIQFESIVYSLLIMMCIPFALTGSILLLFIAHIKLSMVSLMGILMLGGLVVNNGIIFIDTANMNRDNGMEIKEALIEAGKSRMRPIFMTTLTTILSMIPISSGLSENGKIMQAMGLVIIGGLVASTVLTLILIPTFYLIVDKLRRKKKNADVAAA
ncbi:MAG: efflux RND transporter permease subunit [Lachnospiraceae bacterium]|nr:efflux RND transporter permease subunit [Lachnospiraceae bacterium]